MAEHPLKVIEMIDPELLKVVDSTRSLVLADGALSRKVKLLMAMAMDAAKGSTTGVSSLAQQAMKAGATKEEIGEALRVAYLIFGAGSVHTAARGLKDLF